MVIEKKPTYIGIAFADFICLLENTIRALVPYPQFSNSFI